MTEEIKFEKALERLEKIVEELEDGNVSLEDSLKKYEEGVKLSAVCQQRLAQAEKKIEILTRSLDGTLKREAFDPEEEISETEKPVRKTSKAPKSSKNDSAKDDEDLLI